MRWGDFRDYFRGYAWKRLTAHEVDPLVSNGHEFQGVNRLRQVLGTEDSDRIPATYVLLRDDTDDPEILRLWAKWYDSRRLDPNRSAEYRLYYPAAAEQIQRMKAGDLMVIGVTHDGTLLVLLAAAGTERERELEVLFGLDTGPLGALQVRSLDEPIPLDFVAITLLEELGIGDARPPSGDDASIVSELVSDLFAKHPEGLPAGTEVSSLIRSQLPHTDPISAPDESLFRWIEAEAAMYREWEDRKIAARLTRGFTDEMGQPDVEGFRTFSMSLRQSRVSRAGGALQYHIRALLDAAKLQYVMEPEVDGGETPDFLFPSLAAYEDQTFPDDRLRMLAAKFTAKDRWRQVLNEARRIKKKHLLTLEAAISIKQMRLMADASLTLVIPAPIRARYATEQAGQILIVGEFLSMIAELQS
jgi:hypothetical protein